LSAPLLQQWQLEEQIQPDTPDSTMNHLLSQPFIRQALVGLVCVAVLLAVLWMYLQPDFLLTLANQVWGCF
jgi:hypothetical protein